LNKFPYDVKEAIGSIESYLGEDRDFISCVHDKMLRRAVEREFGLLARP
jgi:hypothetical protein